MTTLDEAWGWYQSTKRLIQITRRLAANYWDTLPWDGRMGRDHVLSGLTSKEVGVVAEDASRPVDDVATVVLFSVFEATVRQHILDAIAGEIAVLRHPSLRHAGEEARHAIEEGSFFRVLEPFKSGGNADAVEHVNQVRRYRNWVAHGRRGRRPDTVEPEAAYIRLKAFLDIIQPPLSP